MRSLVRGLFWVVGSRPTRQMMMIVILAVTGAGSSETTVPYLSCSFPFWHMLTKGERGKIEMFLLCHRRLSSWWSSSSGRCEL